VLVLVCLGILLERKVAFATVGVFFALIKVSVYSLIGTITENQQEQ
jgi:hypothetical protein